MRARKNQGRAMFDDRWGGCALASAALLGALVTQAGCYEGVGVTADPAVDASSGGSPSASTTGDDGAGDGSSGADSGEPTVDECTSLSLAPSPMRRLTQAQYLHSVRDVLAVDLSDVDLPTDGDLGLITSNTLFYVAPEDARAYMVAAETAAQRANLEILAECVAPALGDAALQSTCAESFVESVGRRIVRAPLDPELRGLLLGTYDAAIEDADFDAALRRVLTVALQLPDFLYLVEVGEPTAGVPEGYLALTNYEVASRLSYMLWASTPDDALLDAAAAGLLSTPSDIEAQARRMLQDARAEEMLAGFHTAWLGADLSAESKNLELYPFFDAALVAAFAEERRRFVADVVFQNGTVEELLTAPFTYVNNDLAALYELDISPLEPDAWTRVTLDDGRRQGILTQGGVLAAHAGPSSTPVIKRGSFMLTDVACGVSPPFPNDFVPTPMPPGDASMSPREQWEQLHAVGPCGGCHMVLDPLGWAYDNFDAVGRWRDELDGFPIDASATWEDLEFDGAVDLSNQLAARGATRDCYAKHWVTFSLERLADEYGEDACAMADLFDRFEESGGEIEALLVSIATADMFRYLKSAP